MGSNILCYVAAMEAERKEKGVEGDKEREGDPPKALFWWD
jgi:hypothetical protein